jgi:hypothetical protein
LTLASRTRTNERGVAAETAEELRAQRFERRQVGDLRESRRETIFFSSTPTFTSSFCFSSKNFFRIFATPAEFLPPTTTAVGPVSGLRTRAGRAPWRRRGASCS